MKNLDGCRYLDVVLYVSNKYVPTLDVSEKNADSDFLPRIIYHRDIAHELPKPPRMSPESIVILPKNKRPILQ